MRCRLRRRPGRDLVSALAGGLFLLNLSVAHAADAPSWQRDIESCRAFLPESELALPPETGEAGQGQSEECGIEKVELGINYFCPEETDRLLAHPLSSMLVAEREQLQLSDLEGFYWLAQDYAGASPLERVGLDSMSEALAQLDMPRDTGLSFWQRVREWWKSLFGDSEPPEFEWLKDFTLSEDVVKAVMYSSLGLIVLLALVIVGMEVRAAGRYRRADGVQRWRDAGPGRRKPLTLDEVRGAPLAEQPGLLLLLLLQRLTDAGQLQVASSFTHRDISAAARGLGDGGDLEQLSVAAERAAYGGWEPREKDVSALFALLERSVEAIARRRGAAGRDTDG